MDSLCSTPSSSRALPPLHESPPRRPARPQSTSTQHSAQPSSSALSCTSVHSVRPGQKFVTVHSLTRETLTVVVDAKTRVRDLFWCCCEQLQLNDERVFGLALRSPSEGLGGDSPRHEYFFLDPTQRVFKYAPRQPRFAPWASSPPDSRPLLVLFLRVRVYLEDARLITCERALEHYYRQLRDNLLDQWAGSHSVNEERCWELAALALRADKGDRCEGGYFRAEQYFPLWLINLRGLDFVRANMPRVCETSGGEISHREALVDFCIVASRSPFALNCHLYGLRRHKMDSVDNALMGISPSGIEMCDVGPEGERIPLRSLAWSKMTKLSFDRRRLSIQGVDGAKMWLYAQSEGKARYLLELCRAVHQSLLSVAQHASLHPLSPSTCNLARLGLGGAEKSVDGLSQMSNSTSGIVSDQRQSDCDRDSEVDESLRSERASTMLTARPSETRPSSRARRLASSRALKSPSLRAAESDSDDDEAARSTLQRKSEEEPREEETVIVPPLSPPVEDAPPRRRSDSAQEDCLIRTFSSERENGVESVSVEMPSENLLLPHVDIRRPPSIRQPPGYGEAPLGVARPSYGERQTYGRRGVQTKAARWTTVTGVDADLSAHLDAMQVAASLAPQQARSEPRLDYSMWNMGEASTSRAPPQGHFVKQPQRVSRPSPHISRVQSMPAQQHSAFHAIRLEEEPPPSLQHAQSMNAGARKQPPSYARALELQAAAAAAQTPARDELSLNSRIRDFPMIRALWEEHQQQTPDTRLPPPPSDFPLIVHSPEWSFMVAPPSAAYYYPNARLFFSPSMPPPSPTICRDYRVPSRGVLDLPPPPPYPHPAKAPMVM